MSSYTSSNVKTIAFLEFNLDKRETAFQDLPFSSLSFIDMNSMVAEAGDWRTKKCRDNNLKPYLEQDCTMEIQHK